jgi:hypothetical protein
MGGGCQWSGQVTEIDSAVHALAAVYALRERGMLDIGVRAHDSDGTSCAIAVSELTRLATLEASIGRT